MGIFLFLSSVIGLFAAFIAILFTLYYTNINYKPTRKVAEASQEAASLNVLTGLSNGLYSTFYPIIIFGVSVIFSFLFGYYYGFHYFTGTMNSNLIDIFGEPINFTLLMICFGIWGVSMASSSSDTIISTILSFDTFGPIMDNAAGIVEMGKDEAPEQLRRHLEDLDALGNTTKAISKGFALICGGLSSFVLFLTFLMSAHSLAYEIPTIIPPTQFLDIFNNIDLFNPLILLGLFTGALVPFLFSAMVISAVKDGARLMVKEVRRQYKEIPGLKEGNAIPEYDKCIKISAKSALTKMLKPVLTVVLITIIMGILLGPMVIAGFLIGNLIGCLILGLFLSIGGASLDNAKKGIESGLYGGKNSFAHKAAIIGDTIGDPLKDSAGPSMNIIITTVNTMALTFLPLFMMTGYLWSIFPVLI